MICLYKECYSQIITLSAIPWKYPSSRGHPKYIQPYNNDGIHHFTNLGPVYMEVGDP